MTSASNSSCTSVAQPREEGRDDRPRQAAEEDHQPEVAASREGEHEDQAATATTAGGIAFLYRAGERFGQPLSLRSGMRETLRGTAADKGFGERPATSHARARHVRTFLLWWLALESAA